MPDNQFSPYLTYHLNFSFLTSNDPFVTLNDLKKASYINSGVYKCEAENRAGQQEIDYVIEVQIAPIIAPEQPTNDVIIGQTSTLRCSVDGIPVPSIQWFKDGKIIDQSDPGFQLKRGGEELVLLRTTDEYLGT